jgi:hypothetical protein
LVNNSGTEEDIQDLRTRNPRMRILLSLGGDSLKGEVFR